MQLHHTAEGNYGATVAIVVCLRRTFINLSQIKPETEP